MLLRSEESFYSEIKGYITRIFDTRMQMLDGYGLDGLRVQSRMPN